MSVPRNLNDPFELVRNYPLEIGTCDLSDQNKVWLELWYELSGEGVKKKKNKRKKTRKFYKGKVY